MVYAVFKYLASYVLYVKTSHQYQCCSSKGLLVGKTVFKYITSLSLSTECDNTTVTPKAIWQMSAKGYIHMNMYSYIHVCI
jgi:hypothetical protein